MKHLWFLIFLTGTCVLLGCDSPEVSHSREPRRGPVTEYGQAVQKARDARGSISTHDEETAQQIESLFEDTRSEDKD